MHSSVMKYDIFSLLFHGLNSIKQII